MPSTDDIRGGHLEIAVRHSHKVVLGTPHASDAAATLVARGVDEARDGRRADEGDPLDARVLADRRDDFFLTCRRERGEGEDCKNPKDTITIDGAVQHTRSAHVTSPGNSISLACGYLPSSEADEGGGGSG